MGLYRRCWQTVKMLLNGLQTTSVSSKSRQLIFESTGLADFFSKWNRGKYAESGSELTGRNYSRIKACRLAPPRRITSARSAGRRSGNPRFSGNCHHVFRVFVQLVMWRQIWGTDVRFDLLFPLTLTAAMNLAVSTVTWQRNFQFFCKRGE